MDFPHVFWPGKERELAGMNNVIMSADTGDASGIRQLEWMNPPYDQTAGYLNYIHERLRSDSEYRGLILVPCRPECQWWNLTDGLNVLYVWDAGSECIEEWRGGGWRPLHSKYKLAALSSFKPVTDVSNVDLIMSFYDLY